LLDVAGLQNVWLCAQDLQLIRADRIVSLMVPIATGYGAASPADQALHKAVCAEIEGGTGGETLTRVKLADCGKSPAAELLAGLASVLGWRPRLAGTEGVCSSSPSKIRTGSPGGHLQPAPRRLAAKLTCGKRSRGPDEVTSCPVSGGTLGLPVADSRQWRVETPLPGVL
jgi:hypothetical protein